MPSDTRLEPHQAISAARPSVKLTPNARGILLASRPLPVVYVDQAISIIDPDLLTVPSPSRSPLHAGAIRLNVTSPC
jgi:hypothetical protein